MSDEEINRGERLAYRVNEAAALLGLSRTSIYALLGSANCRPSKSPDAG